MVKSISCPRCFVYFDTSSKCEKRMSEKEGVENEWMERDQATKCNKMLHDLATRCGAMIESQETLSKGFVSKRTIFHRCETYLLSNNESR